MYTLGEAARATGKQKSTILNAIKSGKVSASRDAHNQWQIDPAELHRVYAPVSSNGSKEVSTEHDETPIETMGLRVQVEALREQLQRERELNGELSRRLDQSETERRETQTKLTALLTHQAEKAEHTKAPEPTATPSPLWQKLFGRGGAS